MLIIGVDLAWGDKKADGVCFLRAKKTSGRILGYDYPQGDQALVASIESRIRDSEEILMTIDAPLVLPNVTGTRPVDRLTHRMFHREHAACHPANLRKCPRPPRVLGRLASLGIVPGWEVRKGMRVAAEVYPHPAMVRLFRLPRIVKYKKGSVREKRKEFKRLQRLMRKLIKDHFGRLRLDAESVRLLRETWSKPVEDRLDALFCALIGYWHWRYRGKRSEVIGDIRTGFILLPEDLRKRKNHPR